MLDEVTAADEFHDRLVRRTLMGMDTGLILKALSEGSPMQQSQGLTALGHRLRIRLLVAFASDVACPILQRSARVLELEERFGSFWRKVEQHVPTCQTCSTYHEGRDVLQLLRSPALARRLLAEAATVYQGPTCHNATDRALVISPDAFEIYRE
ncbi:hypothetical protein [Streptomyces sp. NPDC005244]|uniref:hypothetical protein n=1 Tax=Streptomyces sp. NPDC005244 TaxID=3364708 RepID=UPI0036D15ADB